MWVRIVRERRFLAPEFNHRLGYHFRPDQLVSVKRAWGRQLIADGDAVEAEPPRRSRDVS